MSDRSSFPFRLVRNMAEAPGTAQSISDDLFAMVRRAAGEVRPGSTVAEQINMAWANLGKPAMWRVRSAWWRDGSGAWSAAAVRDFQTRFQAHLDREAQRAAQAQAIEQAMQPASEPEFVRLARADYQDLTRRIAALESALRLRP